MRSVYRFPRRRGQCGGANEQPHVRILQCFKVFHGSVNTCLHLRSAFSKIAFGSAHNREGFGTHLRIDGLEKLSCGLRPKQTLE